MAATRSKSIVVGKALPNIPWEERPAGCREAMWRSQRNPVIPRHLIPSSNSIFNSAVVPFGKGFAGVFRCDTRGRDMQLHAGFSPNGYDWTLDNKRIHFLCDDPDIGEWVFGFDPRVTWLEDRYYVTWANGYHGGTIGLAWTRDFKTFHQMENLVPVHNRNGVLFPRRIKGRYALLSRPSDTGHTPFGDIFYSESPDLVYWGRHRFVMGRGASGWQSTKIGAGPCPIETREGWLLIYHGVLASCNGFTYSAGAALLDLDEPWKVIRRSHSYLISPQEIYECAGDTPNVVFPTAALVDAPTGRMAIYYGAADTCTCLAFARVDEILDFLKKDKRPD
jgi:beta-1,4-mannooligosaccharide/beta-1,4-mannosyl-N-acetylglucosamine phosphorylase